MSRSRAQSGPTISLFPFLAVLLCMMGALLVLLVLFSRSAKVADTTAADEARQRAAEAADEELRLARDEIAWRIEQLREIRDRTADELAKNRMQLAGTEEDARKLADELDGLERALQALEDPSSEDAGAEAIRDLERRLAEVQKALAGAKDGLAAKPPAYAVVPYAGANGTHRRPLYIECCIDGVFLQPENIRLGPADFEGPPGPGNPLASALRAAREHLARAPGESGDPGAQPYPLLLVRPSGVMAYYAAREAIQSWGSEFGYQFVDEEWTLTYPARDPALAEVETRAIEEARRRLQWLAQVRSSKPAKPATTYRAATTRGGVVSNGGPSVLGDQSRFEWTEQQAGGAGQAGPGRGFNASGDGSGAAGDGGLAGGDAGGGDVILGNGGGRGPAGSGIGAGGGRDGTGSGDGAALGSRYAGPSKFYSGSGGGTGTNGGSATNGGTGTNGGFAAGGGTATGGDSATGGDTATGGGTGRAGGGDTASGGSATPGSGRAAGGDRSGSGEGSAAAGADVASSAGGPGGGATSGSSSPGGGAGGAGGAGTTAGSAGGGSGPAMPGLHQAGGGAAGGASAGGASASLAGRRGSNWASLATQDNPVPLTRPIRLECAADEFRIIGPGGRVQSRIPVGTRTVDSIDPLVREVHATVGAWGLAGDRMYWKPELVLSATPDGVERRDDLEKLLADSGIDTRRSETGDRVKNLPPVTRTGGLFPRR